MTLLFVSIGTALVLALGTIGMALTGTSPVHLPGFPDPSPNARPPGVQPGPNPAGTSRAATATASATATPSQTHGHKPTAPPSHPKTSKK
jgi:hypothetical protein